MPGKGSAGTKNTPRSPGPESNWINLSTYFKHPQEVRRQICTTNVIEGLNRRLRKVTKAKSVFPTDDSLLKMLYFAMMDITKKWAGRRQDCSLLHAQMAIHFCAHTQVTPPVADVKGTKNEFTALTTLRSVLCGTKGGLSRALLIRASWD